MNTELVKTNGTYHPATQTAPLPAAIESALVDGDLSKLDVAQRVSLYNETCKSLRLNPLTKPFAYILLDSPGGGGKKLTLYARRDCTDQLRAIHGVSVPRVSSERVGDIYIVTAQGKTANGREDTSTGAVWLKRYKNKWDSIKNKSVREYDKEGNPIAIDLVGDELANAFMKAETKAKRRVTLSICGLGWVMDETEIETTGAEVVDENYSVTPIDQALSQPLFTEDHLRQIEEKSRTTLKPLENPWLHKRESGKRDVGKYLFQLDAGTFGQAQRAYLQERISEADYVNMIACLENPELRQAALEEIEINNSGAEL